MKTCLPLILLALCGCFGMNRSAEETRKSTNVAETTAKTIVKETRTETPVQSIVVSGNVTGPLTITPEKPVQRVLQLDASVNESLSSEEKVSQKATEKQFNPFTFIYAGIGFLLILLAGVLAVLFIKSMIAGSSISGGVRALSSVADTISNFRKANLDPLVDAAYKRVEEDTMGKLDRLHRKR